MKRQFTIRFCTALALMFGTLLLNAVQPPKPPIKPPMPPVRMPRVLFISNQGSTHFRLYSMYLDGSDVRQIPNWTDNDNWPSYSPRWPHDPVRFFSHRQLAHLRDECRRKRCAPAYE